MRSFPPLASPQPSVVESFLLDRLAKHKNEIQPVDATASILAFEKMLVAVDRREIEINNHSRFHRMGGKSWLFGEPPNTYFDECPFDLSKVRPFVVQHDWRQVIALDEADKVVKLPFDECVFEFMVGGMPVSALAAQAGTEIKLSLCCQLPSGCWLALESSKRHALDFFLQHVQAICIFLDAEVAIHEVVRAPAALNAKRARSGKAPIRDHYIIDLARRHRLASCAGGHSEPGRVRLHFRRGHWRHFESHKTWIKWMLVGNPDLGFVKSRYKI
jgi:hypothetical protein